MRANASQEPRLAPRSTMVTRYDELLLKAPAMYRAPVRADRGEFDPDALRDTWRRAVDYCRTKGVVGVGWRLTPRPHSVEDALERTRTCSEPGWGSSAANVISRLHGAAIGSLDGRGRQTACFS